MPRRVSFVSFALLFCSEVMAGAYRVSPKHEKWFWLFVLSVIFVPPAVFACQIFSHYRKWKAAAAERSRNIKCEGEKLGFTYRPGPDPALLARFAAFLPKPSSNEVLLKPGQSSDDMVILNSATTTKESLADILEGVLPTCPLTFFTYTRTAFVSAGGRLNYSDFVHHLVLAESPLELPRMRIIPRRDAMSLPAALLFEHEDFSRLYCVIADDTEPVRALFSPEMFDFMVTHQDLDIRLSGNVVSFHFEGPLEGDDVQSRAGQMLEFLNIVGASQRQAETE